jgi:hypothetical protein
VAHDDRAGDAVWRIASRYLGVQLQNGVRRASATIFPLPEIGNFGPGA